ncbi:uncharacterized protein LOC126812589 isoform X2 [Patella vulgata]|uniref:uncharacterized protein LOC126812589 isoform X2 n=1 Tax=Patella vulgata TaxID=6465 RepID=UPI00217FC837|nr:uncharacterized protein LOC126812589 isoform X2 [Patella vulgata]
MVYPKKMLSQLAVLSKTTACEPPRKIERGPKDIKKQHKFNTSEEDRDEPFTDSPEDSIETDIKTDNKQPFKYQSDGSKAESDSGESESPDGYVSEAESLSGDVPQAKVSKSPKFDPPRQVYPSIAFDKSNCDDDEDGDDDDDDDDEDEDSDTIIDGKLDAKSNDDIPLIKWSASNFNNNNTTKELSKTLPNVSDPVLLKHIADDSSDDRRSDSTDDTPLSVLRTSLQENEISHAEKTKQEQGDTEHALSDQQPTENDEVDDVDDEHIDVDDSANHKPENSAPKEKPNFRSPEKNNGHQRESRLTSIINHLRTSKEKLSPSETKPVTMSEGLLMPSFDETSSSVEKYSKERRASDDSKEEKADGKDLEPGEIRRSGSTGPNFDSTPMTASSLPPQPMVPPPYFGVPFDPQYPMLGLSLQHLFAQNLATSYGMNGMSFPQKPFPDLTAKSKPPSTTVKAPAATMTKEEYNKQQTTSPTAASTPQPRFTSSPVGSTSSRGSAPSSSTSPNYSAEKAAVMAKLTEKLAKISNKPPEVIDKTVKYAIKRAKRMQKLERLQAKLKKHDFVSPIAGKSNKEYYRDRSPERQPQRYGDPSIRADKRQLPANPPPAHQNSKHAGQPSFLPTPGLSVGYPYPADVMANISPLQIPLPSLQMWQSCFPFTMPPPGLETTRFTQFFHNLNGGMMASPTLKRPAEESVVDLSSKRQKLMHSEKMFYRDSGSDNCVTSIHSPAMMHSLPNVVPSPNHSSGSPTTESSSSPFLSNGPQLNCETSSSIPTSFAAVSSLAGQQSLKQRLEESIDQALDGMDDSENDGRHERQGHKLNGFGISTWSDYERKKSSMECTCEFKHIDDIRRWSTEDVCRFMRKLDGCGPYIETFRRAGVDGSSLPLLTTDSLTKSLGMKLGPALVLTGAVARKAREISKIVPCSYCRKKIQRG